MTEYRGQRTERLKMAEVKHLIEQRKQKSKHIFDFELLIIMDFKTALREIKKYRNKKSKIINWQS